MRTGTAAAALLAAVALAYAPGLSNGFVYDDHEVILRQEPVRSLGDAARIFTEPHGLPQSKLPYYRPVTRLSLLAQKALHGDDALGYRLGNAALAGGVALAAFALLRAPALGLGTPAAAWTAAAFVLHPIASECVHPIASGRESAMPALFVLLALAAWLRGGRGGRAAALAAFATALWSKEQAIVVPALVALGDALGLAPEAPGRSLRRWAARLGPFVLVAAAYLAVRAAVMPPPEAPTPSLGAHLAAHPFAPAWALLYLVQSVYAPFAGLRYEPALAVWLEPLRAALAALAFAAVVALALRRPPRRIALFWVGWIPVAMAFHLGWLPLEAYFAERYVFLASLGVIALTARAAGPLLARPALRRGVLALAAASLAGLAALTIARGRHYRDELAFTRQWVATSPAHANARASHGAALGRAGRTEAALAELREAVRLEPRLASAHYNLGVLLAWQGRHDEASAAFREALRWDPGDASAREALEALRSGTREGALTEPPPRPR